MMKRITSFRKLPTGEDGTLSLIARQ